jgi:hypothetical protein
VFYIYISILVLLFNIKYLLLGYRICSLGYIIYSNGYCEQWGRSEFSGISAGSSLTNTVTFIKSFKNTYYNMNAEVITTSGGGSHTTGCANLTTASLSISIINRNGAASITGYISWNVSGYLADGEY